VIKFCTFVGAIIMKKIYLILLALFSGILLSLGWPAGGFPALLFVAFVPLLFVEDYIVQNRHNFIKGGLFLHAYLAFFVWNLCTTWWIYNSTLFGAVMAFVFNSLFMAITFHFYHVLRRNLFKGRGGYIVLIFFWVTYEYLHLDWDLTWSWLNLGNGFATFPQWIQWYEYTGTFGGTIWILAVNILIFLTLKYAFGLLRLKKRVLLYGLSTLVCLIIPITTSYLRYNSYKETTEPVNIVVVQPNIDPYNEKFGGMTSQQQLDKIIGLARQKITTATDFVVCPETAIPEGIVENELNESWSVDSLKALLADFPKLKIVIGISSFIIYEKGENRTETARVSGDSSYYFDVCNTAMYYDSAHVPQLYHKSKLVPGVEKMPFPKIMKPLEKFAIDLGGMTGSNATQEERSVFVSPDGNIKIAPVICYESIYGDFLTGYIRNGANLIFILTNDGWWGDTPGHRQHFEYARLRAIETRRSIARSANTGISGFINQRGDVLERTGYWEDGVLSMSINANEHMTFYSRFGDYFGKIFQYFALSLLIVQFIMLILNMRFRIRSKKSTKNSGS
jgi:apolipoprotein N-acyltransferase